MVKKSDSFLLEGTNKDTAVVVIHGFTVSPDYMRDIAKDINDCGYTVYAPMLAGHGVDEEYFKTASYKDWMQNACDSVQLLKDKGYRKVIALGHSMGGLLSLYLAQEKLVDAVISLAAPYHITRYKKVLFFTTFCKNRFTAMGGNDYRDGYFRYHSASGKSIGQLVKAIHLIRKNHDKIECPAFIVNATNDKTVVPVSGGIIYNKISSSEKHYMDIDTEHQCTIEHRHKYMPQVLEFIKKHS